MDNRNQAVTSEFEERVVKIDRIARVVRGGRRFRFRAIVFVGDRKGQVGMGIAKGKDVTTAIAKSVNKAKKHLLKIPLQRHGTIPYQVTARFNGAKVMLKPAGPGTGVIAGGAIRDALEVAGVTDILTKSLGSSNKINSSYATMAALTQILDYDRSHQGNERPVATKKQGNGAKEAAAKS